MSDTKAADETHLETIVDRYLDTWNVAGVELRLETVAA
jgi:hypothetical protein